MKQDYQHTPSEQIQEQPQRTISGGLQAQDLLGNQFLVEQRLRNSTGDAHAQTTEITGAAQCAEAPWAAPVSWLTPWLVDTVSNPGCPYVVLVGDEDSRCAYDSGWQRDDLSSGMLGATQGLVSWMLTRRLGLDALGALIPAVVGFGSGLTGLHIEERAWGDTIEVHEWYGRYRTNLMSGDMIACEFKGTSETTQRALGTWRHQQRICDGQGRVLGTHTLHETVLDSPQVQSAPPETSFGSFQ